MQGGTVAGVLTVIGQEQAYVLGRRLADRYHSNLKLIGNSFDPKEVRLVRCLTYVLKKICLFVDVIIWSSHTVIISDVSPWPCAV